MNWQRLYQQASSSDRSASGYYNRNVRIDSPVGPTIVRIPIPGAEMMDLRIWDEVDVLPTIAPFVDQVPTLLHESLEPPYQVHRFIEGTVLHDVSPRGTAVPDHVVEDVAGFFAQLARVPIQAMPVLPHDWPTGTDSIGFALRLESMTREIHAAHRGPFADVYAALEVPVEPLAPISPRLENLRPRPLVLVHADIHRKNLIIRDRTTFLLDWELALWGDPVYDLAVHLHKMSYLDHERDALLSRWETAVPAACSAGWLEDLDAYLAHEQVKSAIVDSVRSCRAFLDESYSPDPRSVVVDKLTGKLNRARQRWGFDTPITNDAVETCLHQWARKSERK